jgi:hypothetical protein
MMFRVVFWDILPCKIIVDSNFTWQYIPEDNSEHQKLRMLQIVTETCDSVRREMLCNILSKF